jgi:quercetin dioxygenase-like cupin family protein
MSTPPRKQLDAASIKEVTMRSLATFFTMLVLVAGPALAQDPVVVDSKHYKVEFENDHVRVLRITYGPNEESVMHYHPGAVAVFLTDQTGRFTLPNGEVVDFEGKAGQAIWTEAGDHLPENATDQPLELILVEMKVTPPEKM